MNGPRKQLAPRYAALDVLDDALTIAAALDRPVQVQLGATVFASLMLARSRMPVLLAAFAAVGFGYAARSAYIVGHDIHRAAIAITEGLDTAVEADPGAD